MYPNYHQRMSKKIQGNSWLGLLIFLSIFLSGCSSGPCDYPDDVAKDGSRCGDRAASVRPGGRNPDRNKFLIGLSIAGVIIFVLAKTQSSSNKTPVQTPEKRQSTPTSAPSVRLKRENKTAIRHQVFEHDIIEDMFARNFENNKDKSNYKLLSFVLNQKTDDIPSKSNLAYVERIYSSIFNRAISPHDLAELYRVVGNAEKHSYNKHDAAIYFILLHCMKLKPNHPVSLEKLRLAMSSIADLSERATFSKGNLNIWCEEVKNKLKN